MKNLRFAAAVCLAAAGVVGAAIAGAAEALPPVADEHVRQLVQVYLDDLKSPDSLTREAATGALENLGPEASQAVPALVEGLHDKDTKNRKAAVLALARCGKPEIIVPLLKDADPVVCQAAVDALFEVHYKAADAVEPLLAIVLSPKAAARTRLIAGCDLAGTGGVSPAVLPDLLRVTEEKNSEVRLGAIRAFSGLDFKGPEAVATLVKLLSHPDPEVRAEAAGTLGRMGPAAKDAVPALTDLVEKGDLQTSLSRGYVLWKVAPPHGGRPEELLKALASPQAEERWKAAWGLGRVGQLPAEAVASLIKALDDDDPRVRRFAAITLAHEASSRDTVLPALKARLHDGDGAVRAAMLAAALTLYGSYDDLDPAVLAEALKDPEADVRRVAAAPPGTFFGLGEGRIRFAQRNFGGGFIMDKETLDEMAQAEDALEKKFVAALAPALKDSDAGVRRYAAESLGSFGPLAQEAVPDLVLLLKDDPDPKVRSRAAFTLGEIGIGAKASVPEIVAAIKDQDSEDSYLGASISRRCSARMSCRCLPRWHTRPPAALRRTGRGCDALGPVTDEVVQDLIGRLKSDSLNTRVDTAYLLSEMCGGSRFPTPRKEPSEKAERLKAVIPALRENLKSHCGRVRTAAANALRVIGDEPGPSVEALIEVLRDCRGYWRDGACTVLEDFGAAGHPAEKALLNVLKTDKDRSVLIGACVAMKYIKPTSPDTVPVLAKLLESKDSGVSLTAAQVLWDIGPKGVMALLELADHPDPNCRKTALELVAHASPPYHGQPAVLIEALKDKRTSVRALAARYLGRVTLRTGLPAATVALAAASRIRSPMFGRASRRRSARWGRTPRTLPTPCANRAIRRLWPR